MKSRRARVRNGQVLGPEAPRISVVIPCYNYGHFLPAAVGSVLAQPAVDVDVLILDDASTDDSQEIANRLAADDQRIRVVAHSRNLGHVETYNEGLALATGEFVVKLDADDLLTRGSLRRSADLMRANPDVVFCYGHPIQFQGLPPEYLPGPVRSWSVWDGGEWIRRVVRRGHNVIMQPEVFLRRTAVEATGGYRPQLRWAEDYNWWLRLASIGSVGRVNGVAQGLYRVHGASLQRSATDLEFSDLQARLAAVDLFFDEQGSSLDTVDTLRETAYRSLLRDARRLAARAYERPDGRERAIASFDTVAAEIEVKVGHRVIRGLSASPTRVGRLYRSLEWNVRSRRWRRSGIS